MMKHKNTYASIRSLPALRAEERRLARELHGYEKKIRNDYSVFKLSFGFRTLIHSALSRIPLYAFISRILPLLRKP
jgi:hypothetical protein